MTILASTLRPRTFRHLSLDDYVKSANVGIAEAVWANSTVIAVNTVLQLALAITNNTLQV
jgi:hypothetical protein